jgi:hypothetical protein
MTYFVRALLLSFSTFFLSYVLLSLALAFLWRTIGKKATRWSAPALYSLRALPPMASLALIALFVLPSFFYLEPQQAGESFGVHVLALALGGLLVLGFGAVSAFWALWRTNQYVSYCSRTGHVPLDDARTLAIDVTSSGPILLIAGIRRPTLLVSEQVRRLLNKSEMHVAIRHELAHARRHDNLKKLMLRFWQFPWLKGLDRSWMSAAEVAADTGAVTDESSAVDLASALLKLASQSSGSPMPEIAMNLVRESDDALRERVERLLSWKPSESSPKSKTTSMVLLLSVLGLFVVAYAPALHQVHEFTEMLMR